MELTVFDTAIGVTGVAWTDAGICAVVMAEADRDQARARLSASSPAATESTPPPAVRSAIERITSHLDGRLDDLRDVELDLSAVSGFRRDVYEALRAVAPGETITYGELAARVGEPHGAREVGQAMGSNPVPIIVPCHRCLAADGKLGGFSAPGGVATKLRLLGIEGAATPQGQTALF